MARASVRSGRAAVRPFLRLFVAPAVLCALGFAAALAAVMQYSLRAYVPGSLDAGGFTLENFTALAKPLYARVFLDTVWICFALIPTALLRITETELFAKAADKISGAG